VHKGLIEKASNRDSTHHRNVRGEAVTFFPPKSSRFVFVYVVVIVIEDAFITNVYAFDGAMVSNDGMKHFPSLMRRI